MSTTRSTETQLRHLNEGYRKLVKEREVLIKQHDALRTQNTALIVDRDEWKRRFDKLLERTPKIN